MKGKGLGECKCWGSFFKGRDLPVNEHLTLRHFLHCWLLFSFSFFASDKVGMKNGCVDLFPVICMDLGQYRIYDEILWQRQKQYEISFWDNWQLFVYSKLANTDMEQRYKPSIYRKAFCSFGCFWPALVLTVVNERERHKISTGFRETVKEGLLPLHMGHPKCRTTASHISVTFVRIVQHGKLIWSSDDH